MVSPKITQAEFDKQRIIVQTVVADGVAAGRQYRSTVSTTGGNPRWRTKATLCLPVVEDSRKGIDTPTEQPAAADACSEALVIGNSMTFALSKHGLGKLCGKSVTIKSTSGAVPATAARPTDIKDVQEIVLHVGTNWRLNRQPALPTRS